MNYKLHLAQIFLIFFIVNSLSAQSWDNLGKGLDEPVRILYADTLTGNLYIGGNFAFADSNISVGGITMWDGINYHPLGIGVSYANSSSASPPPVMAITKYKNEIYVGGYFGKAGGMKANGIAKWNGIGWDTLDSGVRGINGENGVVRDLFVMNNYLYVCGMFDSAGNIAAHNIAKWDGIEWFDVSGFNYQGSSSFTMTYYNGKLFVAGLIQDSLGSPFNIASWDGIKWETVGGGIKGQMSSVFCMKVYNNELYVGGDFTRLNGNVGENIQKWNGTFWSDVGGGVSNSGNYAPVICMNIFNNKLYVGGGFTHSGGVRSQNLAVWDGNNWCGIGSQIQPLVNTIAVLNNELFIAGGFWYIDSVFYNHLAKWTGGNFVDTCGNSSGYQTYDNIVNSLSVFPNPFSNSTTIQTTKPLQKASLLIYDILGKQVRIMQNLSGNEIIISRDNLPNGLYFFKLTDSNSLIGNGKIIIE